MKKMFNKFRATRENFGKKEYTEYLLKQRYKDNFDEELKENYFAVNWKELKKYLYLDFLVEEEYIYMNKFLEDDICDTMKVELSDYTQTTHCKIVLVNRNY